MVVGEIGENHRDLYFPPSGNDGIRQQPREGHLHRLLAAELVIEFIFQIRWQNTSSHPSTMT